MSGMALVHVNYKSASLLLNYLILKDIFESFNTPPVWNQIGSHPKKLTHSEIMTETFIIVQGGTKATFRTEYVYIHCFQDIIKFKNKRVCLFSRN